MGTISDKLMRIINTKEDIRQALISKGYDVPTSIPFKEYAKMISDLPCKVDDFPKLPGDVTRWYFGGLTNEMMAAMDDPRIEDADHKGRFLSFKNFAWGGMSGVGGYTENYNSNKWYKVESRIDATWTYKSFNARSIKDNRSAQLFYQSLLSDTGFRVLSCTIKVSGLTDGQGIEYVSNGTQQFVIMRIENDGIYHLPSFDFGAKNAYYGFKFLKLQESCNITIEQLPLYPGALVFDGVDDYGICDNFPILTKEKGYTVVALRQWIEEKNDSTALVSNCEKWGKNGAFLFEYNNLRINFLNVAISFGHVSSVDRGKSPFSYQTSKLYNGKNIEPGSLIGSNELVVGKGNKDFSTVSKVAIWELIILDHDATEEELTKIKDYFVKTYPWLFPDQAWTVAGKTNEDEDRATIANITGNGNDLVLSNFGFAEGSGYGLYAENYAGGRWVQSTDRADLTWTSYSVNITSVKVASTQLYYQSYLEQPSFTVPSYKIKVYGLKDGQTLSYKQVTSEGQQIYKISEDGIYTLPSFPFKANGDWYGFTLNKVQESCDITIEQIPEYEGYLVTDGVDDRVQDSSFKLNKDWTLVGEWVLLNQKATNAGITKPFSFIVYNRTTGLSLFINTGTSGITIENVKSIKAICSDGRIYLDDWSEMLISKDQDITSSTSVLSIGFNGTAYTQIAFKNLGIYNNQILSKDDCIKAYNYLQTLKSK
jgi:hypothetical protein